jgi:hypothetical protein
MAPIARVRTRVGRKHAAFALIGLAALAALLVPAAIARQQVAPVNTAQPTITGTARSGQTLTASTGTWDSTGLTFSYQWVRCPASGGAPDGSDCAVIGGASTSAYVVAAADVSFRLRVRVTATNATAESATAASNATDVVQAQIGPPNTQPPAISGSAVVGSTLTASQGTWTGSGITFAYAWQRCNATGASCQAISGATQSTYAVVAADSGSTLRVAVSATDTSGTNTVTSAQTAVVGAAPTGCPSGTGPIDVDQISLPAQLDIDRQQITPSVVTRSTQTIRVRIHISACGGRSVEGALVYATATPYQQFNPTEQPTAQDGWAVLTMRRQRFFPASQQQQNLVVFIRARKEGEDLLGGISNRRLISFRVNLSG